MSRPNIHNLRKRAKAFGMLVTRTTDEVDRRAFGDHMYVLHGWREDYELKSAHTLYGIRELIELQEAGA